MANVKLLICSILNILKVLTDNLFMKSQTKYIWSSVLSVNLVTESRFSNLVQLLIKAIAVKYDLPNKKTTLLNFHLFHNVSVKFI